MKTEPFQPSLNSIFVYGTLKRGQLRESLWPCKPLMVQDAWTLGSLWDLGNYPGLESGHDPILGEIWILNHHDMEPTFKIQIGRAHV